MTIADVAAERGAKLIRANGIDIAYTDVGDGPPLMLLHGGLVSTGPGWAGSPAAHVDHLGALGEHFRVIAPDTRGSGATVHAGGTATFDVLADDVVALVTALGLDRPLFAGFSEGGTTATVVALRRPDLVRALVNHAGFDVFDPHAMAHQTIRPIFGGRPDATAADPDAAERTIQSMSPVMAAMFATMKADYDGAQGEGHWRETSDSSSTAASPRWATQSPTSPTSPSPRSSSRATVTCLAAPKGRAWCIGAFRRASSASCREPATR
ncbi:MAG TPA: alpha/beta fold hydrolase [Acidimicrobiales bacterium]|nr:alpha/beta fold hydrolase [Acidimicrobiales bacterium]